MRELDRTMRTSPWKSLRAFAVLGLLSIVACTDSEEVVLGTDEPTYSISVTVSGLTGPGLVLQNRGIDDLAIDSDGTYEFPTEYHTQVTYSVTIKDQPQHSFAPSRTVSARLTGRT